MIGEGHLLSWLVFRPYLEPQLTHCTKVSVHKSYYKPFLRKFLKNKGINERGKWGPRNRFNTGERQREVPEWWSIWSPVIAAHQAQLVHLQRLWICPDSCLLTWLGIKCQSGMSFLWNFWRWLLRSPKVSKLLVFSIWCLYSFFFSESLYNLLLILSVMNFHNAVSQCGFFSSIILRLSGLL